MRKRLTQHQRLEEENTLLSNERTMLSYIRTSFAALVFGFAILQFSRGNEHFFPIGYAAIAGGVIFFMGGVAHFIFMKHKIKREVGDED